MANIILTAENFAFGPIGKLLDVAKLLKDRNHKLTFAGYGTSYQLAKNFPFDTLLEIDTDNPKRNIVGIPVDNEEYRRIAQNIIEILPEAPYNSICLPRKLRL